MFSQPEVVVVFVVVIIIVIIILVKLFCAHHAAQNNFVDSQLHAPVKQPLAVIEQERCVWATQQVGKH
jgi:uncharacterized membrane protein YgaE (UPF0421/DUF939 family)